MQRFIIKEPKYDYKPMRMYYKSIDEAKQKHPDAEITIDTDRSFLSSVEKIKALSEHTLHDYRGRAVWKIPHNGKYILYRQFVGDDGEYIDGCAYQRWDNMVGTMPFGWVISNPKEFEGLFLEEKPFYNNQNLFISLKELKKRKAKKFYNKNNKAYWKDGEGFFYKADKCDLPNTREKEEYERFKGNTEAILVSYGTEPAFMEWQWFDNMDSFKKFFDKKKETHPQYLADLQYEVRRKGYKKLHPNDRKVIVALPYINIDREISFARRDTANENAISRIVASIWCNQVGETNIDWVEDVVKKYIEVNGYAV